MVDLPEPDRPVNHSTAGFWRFRSARACLSTSSDCQWMLAARRSGCRIMPAPTVALVMRSIRMKAPVARFSREGVEGDRRLRRDVADADLVHAPADFAASCAKVLTSMRCFSSVTVALAWSVSVRRM